MHTHESVNVQEIIAGWDIDDINYDRETEEFYVYFIHNHTHDCEDKACFRPYYIQGYDRFVSQQTWCKILFQKHIKVINYPRKVWREIRTHLLTLVDDRAHHEGN